MQKLSARERRHKAVLNKIARLTLARNKGIKAIVAAETQLPALERQARRNELPVQPRKPKEQPTSPAFERHKGEMATMVALKPKRQRKPKVTETTDIPNSEIFGDPGPIDREARMKSMGFRRTSKHRQTPTNTDTR